jgi:hypothetical protein
MNLYNYIFWYNEYESLWYAVPRDSQILFFNGKRNELKNVLSHKDINVLIRKVNRLFKK